MVLVGNDSEYIPEFAELLKADWTAHPLHTEQGILPLVQCHFNIPIALINAPYRIANKVTTFLCSTFALRLPIVNLPDGYFEIIGVPELQEFKLPHEEEVESRQLAKTFFRGTFSASNANHCLLWPKQRLQGVTNMAESLLLALAPDNIQKCMMTRYHRPNFNSKWIFLRLVAVIVACVFRDAGSQAGFEALKGHKSAVLA